ncbi:MAG: class I SAM-dependent methyltransferase [Bacilli bacterium]
MNNNDKLISFWDKVFENMNITKIDGKWIVDSTFNDAIKHYINPDSNILDYGCGTGWALFEIYYTVKLKHGLGIDTSKHAINNALKTKDISGLINLDFIVGNQDILSKYENEFDTAISFNVIDVLEDNIVNSILFHVSKALKDGGHFIVGINPNFPIEFLKSIGYTIEDNYLYKDGILRGNMKSDKEWVEVFSKYFNVISIKTFVLTEKEKEYPRRMFVLQKK